MRNSLYELTSFYIWSQIWGHSAALLEEIMSLTKVLDILSPCSSSSCDLLASCFASPTIIDDSSGTINQNKLFLSQVTFDHEIL